MASNRFDAQQYIKDSERAWNAKDAGSLITKYYDANAEFMDPSTGNLQRGTERLREVMSAWFTAFSEMKIEITQVVQSGNDVAILQHCKGRNTGEMQISPTDTMPGTNKTAEVDVAEFVRVNDQGKIVRDIVVLDMASLLMQLGHLPGATPPSGAKRAVER